MKKITNEQLDSLIRSAVNSSGPLPADEKFAQIISALRELRELREWNDQRGEGEWIEWGGGKRPVISGKKAEVKFRGGGTAKVIAGDCAWSHLGSYWDIIAYRITPEQSEGKGHA